MPLCQDLDSLWHHDHWDLSPHTFCAQKVACSVWTKTTYATEIQCCLLMVGEAEKSCRLESTFISPLRLCIFSNLNLSQPCLSTYSLPLLGDLTPSSATAGKMQAHWHIPLRTAPTKVLFIEQWHWGCLWLYLKFTQLKPFLYWSVSPAVSIHIPCHWSIVSPYATGSWLPYYVFDLQ